MTRTERKESKQNWLEELIMSGFSAASSLNEEENAEKSMALIRKALEKDERGSITLERLESAMEKDLPRRRPYEVLREQLSPEELRDFKKTFAQTLEEEEDLEKGLSQSQSQTNAIKESEKKGNVNAVVGAARIGENDLYSPELEKAIEIPYEPDRPQAEQEEPETARGEGPNMADVQAAELKSSLIQGLDKSADGNTQIEGQDIGAAEEGYVAATDQVKHEAQRARTADGERRGANSISAKHLRAERFEEPINPRIGRRVTFQPHNTKAKLTGKVVDMDDCTVTLQCGRTAIPAIRDKGTFTEAPELDRTHTKEYAQAQARKHVGEQGNVFLAKGLGATYKGVVVELTPTFAIQKVNSETAILHRLKDLEAKEKDGRGEQKISLKENEEFRLIPGLPIQEGKEVSITRESLENGGVTIEPWNKERAEKEKIREIQRSRGSQSW
jgi:hypothetical protein